MKPMIGITVNSVDGLKTVNERTIRSFHQHWNLLSSSYTRTVILAGGLPVLTLISQDEAYNAELVDVLDGLILSGGRDIDPMLSGQRTDQYTQLVSPERDEQELALLSKIYHETNKPIRGIY